MDIKGSTRQGPPQERIEVEDIFADTEGARTEGRRETAERGGEELEQQERGFGQGRMRSERETAPTATVSATPSPSLPVSPKSALLLRVENILSEGLDSIFWQLPKETQSTVRVKGEETARAIEGLLRATQAAAKTILSLIRSWLAMIPGVSSLFLEQEAKIKTDKVLALQKGRKS